MASKRKASKRIVDSDDEDVDPTPKKAARGRGAQTQPASQTPSQPSGSQSQSQSQSQRKKAKSKRDEDGDYGGDAGANDNISTEEKEKLVSNFMRFTLAKDSHKLPVKRDEITKHIIANYKGNKKLANYIIEQAKTRFKSLFGLELMAVKRYKDANGTVYILTNTIDSNLRHQLVDNHSKEEMTHRALLMVILGMIMANSRVIESDQLMDQLKRLGLVEGQPHPQFGDWMKLIETFVKQLYIEAKTSDKKNANGKNIREYRVGARALLEIKKKSILEFVAEIYGEQLDAAQLKELELEDQAEEEEEVEESQTQQSQSQTQSSQSEPRRRSGRNV